MWVERLVLVLMWLSGALVLVVFIPSNKRREGALALLVLQAIIWLCDLFAFRYGLLSAPVREFPKATDLSITINYFFYPALFAVFYSRRKEKAGLARRATMLVLWITCLTIFDGLIEQYTGLLEYGKITTYGMWLYLWLLYYTSLSFCDWFFKKRTLFRADRRRVL
ncbi:CBO0543 family protein [Paenibacillus kobensis]|uniref:CBO0543 family protein n=1 Tax=Paenibacillus kobensis TaxID=59841 RepID=UPI000FDBE1A7|nr:CBO0543 family protein [Paenibacillus kobensis]